MTRRRTRDPAPATCRACDGTGWRTLPATLTTGAVSRQPCWRCAGTGNRHADRRLIAGHRQTHLEACSRRLEEAARCAIMAGAPSLASRLLRLAVQAERAADHLTAAVALEQLTAADLTGARKPRP